MQNKRPTIDKEVLVDARPIYMCSLQLPIAKSTAEMFRRY